MAEEDSVDSCLLGPRTPSSEDQNALAIDLANYSPTWSLLAEATSEDPCSSSMDGPNSMDPDGTVDNSDSADMQHYSQHPWMDLLGPGAAQQEAFCTSSSNRQLGPLHHLHQQQHYQYQTENNSSCSFNSQHSPRLYQDQQTLQWSSNRGHECPMHPCSESTALYQPYGTNVPWTTCAERPLAQQRGSQDAHDRSGDHSTLPALAPPPPPPPPPPTQLLEARYTTVPLPPPEKPHQQEQMIFLPTPGGGHCIAKSMLRTLLTGEGPSPYECYAHRHRQPVQAAAVPIRSRFPQVPNFAQVPVPLALRQAQPVRPVQQLMSFERAFWQVGAPKNPFTPSTRQQQQQQQQPTIRVPVQVPIPIPVQVPVQQQQNRQEFYVVYPMSQMVPKEFVGFPPPTAPGKVSELYVDLTVPAPVAEVQGPFVKRRRYTTVRELLQARIRPPVPTTQAALTGAECSSAVSQQVASPRCPRPQQNPGGPLLTSEPQVPIGRRGFDVVDYAEPTSSSPSPTPLTIVAPPVKFKKGKVNVKEHRPRHFALQALEIGTFKVTGNNNGSGQKATSKNRFKIIFSRRKFLYEFVYGPERRTVTVEVPFESVVGMFAERDLVLVEVNAAPRLLQSSPYRSRMQDVTGGQLTSCLSHKLVLGKPVTDQVRTYLTNFDGKFGVLLGIKPASVPLPRIVPKDQLPEVVDICSPPRIEKQPLPQGASGQRCQCQSGCSSVICCCFKSDSKCSKAPSGCDCTDCANPFDALADNGVDLSAAAEDPCLSYNVRRMTAPALIAVLETEVDLNCCDVRVKVRTVVPGRKKCPNPSCEAKPYFQFSWCERDICRQDESPRNHCQVCHACTDNQTKHCQTCKKCVKTSGVLGLHCSICGSYCGKDPLALFTSSLSPRGEEICD